MYKIGEFSIITGITVKSLRHYHKESLLIPSYIDSQTNYRMYESNQIIQARKVKILRDCDFSLKDIKDIFDHSQGLEDLPYYIEEKLASILQGAKNVNTIKKNLMEETKEKRGENMSIYEVNEKITDEQLVLSVKYVGKYSDCGRYIGKLYNHAKQNACGAPITLYYDGEYSEKANIEVCVPIKNKIKIPDDIKLKTLKKVKGISTMHIGPYDKVGNAFRAIHDYAKKNDLNMKLPVREILLKGPGTAYMGNPNKYETEIFIPTKAKQED